jgi:hypothetical protein
LRGTYPPRLGWQSGARLIHHDAAGQQARRTGGKTVARASQRLRTAVVVGVAMTLALLISGGLALVMTQLLFPCPPGERPGGQGAVY